MNIAFATKQLRILCESQLKAERKFGVIVAKQLRGRLADLRDAVNLSEVPAGRPREIAGTPHKQITIDLTKDCRLILCVNHEHVPLLKSGAVDWSKVSRLRVQKIEVRHDR